MTKKKMNALGDRIKTNYENRTRFYLPRRTYTVCRIDGKAFHSFCKGLVKPFDEGFIEDMDLTAVYLCENIQGAKLAFVQSDEISIILSDFDTISTDSWFDGNIQKMASVSASMASAKFNKLRIHRALSNLDNCPDYSEIMFILANQKLASFDSRFFTIPQRQEVLNYLIFREQDTVRNSISSLAQSLYYHSELEKKNQSDMQEMCFQKGINWNDLPLKQKNGRLIVKQEVTLPVENIIYDLKNIKAEYIRNKWVSLGAPTFTKDTTLFDEFVK